ncbi:hypothetical protein SHI21_05000 [Bacteriovorax sp. PP10]|uniref:DNA polymerase III, delta subunit n=1 Tax=Bacteriovorax antarcticus TaxID=3088717 RepID=A0ABU5VRL0_9BACT|nr:hypothetical protein [Bacteriovorax sp. PP10]MEA9355542.1 hypothetical protein [Bacteriovorax sp. PP10]
MLSKLLPWDYLPKHPTTIDKKKSGIYAFLVEDPYMERVLLERIPKQEIPFSLYSGVDITRDFIEQHFVNLSFFSSTDNIQIINGENIKPDVLKFLIESGIDWSDRFMLIFFTKTNKAFTELTKDPGVHGFVIEEPRFWEGVKLWQFCQKAREINLPPDVSKFVLDHLEHNFESFFWVIDTIKMNFPEGKINIEELKSLVKKERWDFFELIDIFNENPKRFFSEILKKEERDYEWFRALFSFMQGHLSKVLFPEELRQKPKLSKYDQSILVVSEKWSRGDVMKYLKFFSELEIQAKSSDELLINKLRLETI